MSGKVRPEFLPPATDVSVDYCPYVGHYYVNEINVDGSIVRLDYDKVRGLRPTQYLDYAATIFALHAAGMERKTIGQMHEASGDAVNLALWKWYGVLGVPGIGAIRLATAVARSFREGILLQETPPDRDIFPDHPDTTFFAQAFVSGATMTDLAGDRNNWKMYENFNSLKRESEILSPADLVLRYILSGRNPGSLSRACEE